MYKKIIDILQSIVASFMVTVVALLFLGGLGILGYQTLFFAKNGIWKEIAVADLLDFNHIQDKWIGI